jgi:phage gp36-like protein
VYSTVFEVRAAVSSSGGAENPPSQETGTAADLSNAQLTDAINEADSVIDSYIGGRYTTPVASVNDAVPHPIDFWSRNIAAYLATLTKRGSQDFADTDPIARRYTATMLALTAVRDGKAVLPDPIPEILTDTGSGGASGVINTYEGDMFRLGDFGLETTWTPEPWRRFW